jgi:hypothetical protein
LFRNDRKTVHWIWRENRWWRPQRLLQFSNCRFAVRRRGGGKLEKKNHKHKMSYSQHYVVLASAIVPDTLRLQHVRYVSVVVLSGWKTFVRRHRPAHRHRRTHTPSRRWWHSLVSVRRLPTVCC